MTALERKVRLLTGADMWATHDDPELGLPRIVTSDGPVGVRGERWDERDHAVTMPSPTALAASWDEGLVERVGALLAAECARKGVGVLLAPTLNLHRTPLAGRHFECFSEDPLFAGRIGAAYIRGLQAHGVGATAKHYVANDSETERFTLDVRVDERTLREVYLLPFELAVTDAGVWLVMAAYNGVNGATMTESDLLASPLDDEWGFDGVVVSDWTATRSTEAAARARLDLAMPGPESPWGDALVAAVRDGRVPEAAIDEKVRRLRRLAERVRPRPPERVDGGALAREAAAAGMVLVRNDGVLPLARGRLAVIGQNARTARIQGGGSAGVYPPYVVAPLDGLREAFGDVTYALGARTHDQVRALTSDEAAVLRLRVLDAAGDELSSELRRSAHLVLTGLPAETAAVELSARMTVPEGGVSAVGGGGMGDVRLEVDGVVVLDEPIEPPGGDPAAGLFDPPTRAVPADLAAGQEVDLLLSMRPSREGPVVSMLLGVRERALAPEEERARAVEAARGADAAVVVVGTTERDESEGADRASLRLPGDQDELVRAVAAANPRTVVVVNSGGPVEMPWRDDVAAVLLAWFGGQELGHALADVVLGEREPGGRLPTTWPASEGDVPVLSTQPSRGVLDYAEGLHVGYRAWARAGAAPAYPFGHGLGYTRWEYESVEADGRELRVRVRNAGARTGREVVQAYLSRPGSAVERPALWLAGYAAVEAPAGETAEAVVVLDPRAFRHWTEHGWAAEPGAFTVRVGRSAGDLRLEAEVTPPG